MIRIFIAVTFFALHLYASQDRIALVIGNNNYTGENKLYNPINDTKLISTTLQASGFEVQLLNDASIKETNKALLEFQKKLTNNTVGLFYFAGHGVELSGVNYLVPVDANFQNEDALQQTSLDISKIVRIFKESRSTLNIVILDACRDNPLSLNTKGLAPFISPDGLFVAYSAQSGEKALDGPKNGNSPFALSLSQNMLLGKEIESTFKQTRIDVYNTTKGKQRPSTYSEIIEPFYFVKPSKTRGLKRDHTKSANTTVNFIRHKRYIEPQLVLIKAGKYMQGSDDDFDTSPVHEKVIPKEFYVSAYEITFEEYDMFCKHTGWTPADDNGWGRGKHPLINVSYLDAQAYIKWLNRLSKKHYRLITEAEWEYIARAGTQKNYGFSDDEAELELYSWYKGNANNHPHKVGTKKANTYGVYDLMGNVSELTDSSYYKYSSSLYKQGDNSSDEKVVRGGSYFSMYDELEVYKRASIEENDKSKSVGFRLVLEK